MYGDDANGGICSDAVEYAAVAFALSGSAALLCINLRFVIPWMLFSFSMLNLAFGAIVIRDRNFNSSALIFNSRQFTMPAVVYTLSALYLCNGARLIFVRISTIFYGVVVSGTAAQYALSHDDRIFLVTDAGGIVLAAVWAISSYRTSLQEEFGESKA